MAAKGANMSDNLGANSKGRGGTEASHGLPTPEATPAVDDGRIDAEKARQAQQARVEDDDGSDSSVLSELMSDEEGNPVRVPRNAGKKGLNNSDDIPGPTPLVQSIYQEATPLIGRLAAQSDDLNAIVALKALNNRIRQQNEKDGIPPNQWAIDWEFYASEFDRAKPFFERLLNRSEGAPVDEDAAKKIDELSIKVREKTTKSHYPVEWVITAPTEAMVAQAQAAKNAAAKAEAEKAEAEKAKDNEDEEGSKREPTEEQSKAIQEVLKWRWTEYRRILGIDDTYVNSEDEQEAILNALRTLGTLIHPDFVKGQDTVKAFNRVLKAATELGVVKDDTDEVKTWDGVANLFGMEGVEGNDEIPWPTTLVSQIYQLATPLLTQLLIDPANPIIMAELTALNHKIIEQNEKDGLEPNQWTIDPIMYRTHFVTVKPYLDRILNTPEGQPLDEEAMKKIEELNVALKKINAKHHFPEGWCVDDVEGLRAAKLAHGKADTDKLAAEKVAAEKAAAEKAAAEAAAAAKKKADEAAAARKYGNINFPWVTYPLPTGERIIAGRQTTKGEVTGALCCVELPCTDPTDPTFEFRDDIDINELKKYFATPGIKLMGETDKEGRPVKVWRKVDRKDFKKFLFCVVGKRENSNLMKRNTPVCPEVLCCVEMADGITVLNKSGLLNMVGKKVEEGYIRKYCAEKGITPPWDVKPNSYTIASDEKELLDNLKSDRLRSAPAGNSKSENPTTGSSDYTSMADKLAALEKKIESLEVPSTGGRSLDELFSKMEAIETKLAKVDDLSEKMDKTTKILDALCAKIGLV